MVILSMLHYKHTISEHHEHPLPLLLLLLGAAQQIKRRSEVHLVHPDQGCGEDDGCCDMDIEVIAYSSHSVELEYYYNEDREAQAVDAHHRVPLHGGREAAEHQHDQPRGE